MSIYVYNSNGKIVAVLGCDYDAQHVLDSKTSVEKVLSWELLLTLVVALFILNLLVGKILNGITKVNDKIYDLVHNEGDLTQTVDINSGDEVELISTNINELLAYIRNVVISIAKNSEMLSQYASDTVHNIVSAEDQVTDITSTMQEMSAAMEETSASLNKVSEKIGEAVAAINAIASNAKEQSVSSKAVMKNATDIYNKTVKDRATAVEKANQLAISVNEKIEKSKAVEKINDLTDEILNITSQTNLLSLNASIEAARAGEAGRGFAVVAGEIGKLAANSSATAEQIRKVNVEVLTAVNELAVEAEIMLEFMNHIAMQGYEQLLTTSEDYEKNISSLNDSMLMFAKRCDMLSQNAEDIGEAINSINITVEESTKGITNITENAVTLAANMGDISEQANGSTEISANLTTEVRKFKY